MKAAWIIFHLIWLSVEDLRGGRLSLIVILELGMTGISGKSATLSSILPGIVLLLAGRMSKERIGYGDGWLVLALGMWISAERILKMLFWGMLLAVAAGMILKKREVPFVPFLMIGFLLGEWI